MSIQENPGALSPCADDPASRPITVRLSPEEAEKAQRLAREDHRTRAAFIRVMFLRGLASYEKERETSAL
ncbi:putative transcriptional regulator [Herbaspirillum rubrisubalbicans]|uniref:ribbon-helix-helix protein, CopG family n=1 Tax=Herbaspirillum rubrisubalbicans TaxID=80842 RepID=UPI0020A1A095|nr:ribbon-helix-helix protein, CopG family [Herbaspirillum rubrisubalbicans]MCP1573643.1 putative transcriptional regulator [Herbaspirillum rubrisubalbicans]